MVTRRSFDVDIWLDFRRRFLSLLSYKFREFGSVTALSILEAANAGIKTTTDNKSKGWLDFFVSRINLANSLTELGAVELAIHFTAFDLKRLESYANNMLDYHVILDLLPSVASLYFQERLGEDVKLSVVQSSILLALGLQRKTVEEVEKELHLPVSQVLAMFVKVMRKITKNLIGIQKEAISAQLPGPEGATARAGNVDLGGSKEWRSVAHSIEEELEEAGSEETRALVEKQRAMIDALDLKK